MTTTEQEELDHLREQLSSAEASVAHIRGQLTNAVEQLKQELRLYRGLFWCMLAFGIVASIFHLLQR